MNKNMNARISHKRDTETNWNTNNPVLLNGELVLVDTTDGELRVKVGDGTKAYKNLPFIDQELRSLMADIDGGTW